MFRSLIFRTTYAIQKALMGLLIFYRYFISPWLGNRCRFYPSCSLYALQALQEFGIIKGLYLAMRRLCCCHPFHSGGCDPVPKKGQSS